MAPWWLLDPGDFWVTETNQFMGDIDTQWVVKWKTLDTISYPLLAVILVLSRNFGWWGLENRFFWAFNWPSTCFLMFPNIHLTGHVSYCESSCCISTPPRCHTTASRVGRLVWAVAAGVLNGWWIEMSHRKGGIGKTVWLQCSCFKSNWWIWKSTSVHKATPFKPLKRCISLRICLRRDIFSQAALASMVQLITVAMAKCWASSGITYHQSSCFFTLHHVSWPYDRRSAVNWCYDIVTFPRKDVHEFSA